MKDIQEPQKFILLHAPVFKMAFTWLQLGKNANLLFSQILKKLLLLNLSLLVQFERWISGGKYSWFSVI